MPRSDNRPVKRNTQGMLKMCVVACLYHLAPKGYLDEGAVVLLCNIVVLLFSALIHGAMSSIFEH